MKAKKQKVQKVEDDKNCFQESQLENKKSRKSRNLEKKKKK